MSVFSFYAHAHQQQRLHHCLCHPSALHPARRRFTLKSQGPLSTIASIVPSRLTETTTQFTRLLSTPEKTFTNRLPVTERQLPAYSLTRRPHTLSFRSSTPKQRNGKQQAADYSKQHYLSQTLIAADRNHQQHYYNISPSTAAGSNAQERQIHNLPSTLVAERASAPLLLRNVVTILCFGLNGGL